MIEMWFKGFAAGIFFVMTCVLVHQFVSERIKRRKEREFLEMYSRVMGLRPLFEESNEELRIRIMEAMNPPWARRN